MSWYLLLVEGNIGTLPISAQQKNLKRESKKKGFGLLKTHKKSL